ncbi:MAG TPA: deoxyribodipyrimidine photo-lyase, partial [Dyella sp.]
MTTAIVWFRRDLRLADHPALSAACAAHDQVVPLYIHAPEEDGDWAPGGASQWWLHHSLAALQAQLDEHGVALHLRQGNSLAVLQQLLTQTGATAVYWNRLYEPLAIARDRDIKAALREQGVQAHSFNAALWREPWQVTTKQQGPYRVFTPFWRNLRAELGVPQPLCVPSRLPGVDVAGGVPLDS